MSDIFISYASADRERAKLLSTALTNRGWTVWWDRIIPPGMEYAEVIEQALDSSTCVVVLWSTASVASSWVKTEAAEALQRRILVPALIEDTKIPLEFRRLQAADLSQWHGDASHPELLKFLTAVETKIQGRDRPGRDETAASMPLPPLTPPLAAPPPSSPLPPPVRPTRASWPAFALAGGLLAVVAAVLLVRTRPAEVTGAAGAVPPPTASTSALPDVAASVDARPAASPAPPAPMAAQPESVERLVKRDAAIPERPASPSRTPSARDSSIAAPAVPAGPAAVTAPPVRVPDPPIAPPANDPPAAAPEPAAFAMQKFEEVLCVVTIDGEAEEIDAVLVFGGTSLVVTDEDEKVLYTLPYRRVQKATYWKTQRRFVRTTRHWLTLSAGGEEVLLVLPGRFELILSVLEQRTGVAVTRRPG